jgi:hypothetical protein
MRIFTISYHSFGVSVQSAQHPDARVHQEIVAFRGADQAADAIPQGPDRPSAVS